MILRMGVAKHSFIPEREPGALMDASPQFDRRCNHEPEGR